MDARLGRWIAAVGVVLAFVAIWINALVGRSYWDIDGTIGAFLLIMGILGLFVVALNTMRGTLVVGGVLLGFYGWFPAATATDQWHLLDAGAWLGLCGGALMTLGALTVLAPAWLSGATLADPLPVRPLGIAALGLVLSAVAIWTSAVKGLGTYWNARGYGHSLGVVMLIAVILAGVGLAAAAAMRMRAGAGLAAVAGLVTCGLLLIVPVGAAFNQFGDLRAGGWLGFFGGLLLAWGTVALSGERVAIGIAPVRGTPVTPTT